MANTGSRSRAVPAAATRPVAEREAQAVIEVTLDENDRLDRALKAFRRKVERSGVLKDLRNRRRFVKPSTAKRRKAQAAARRVLRQRRRPKP